MSTQLVFAWLLTFLPITMSPGPANILLSSTSAQVGWRRTLPLYFGIVSIFATQIVLVGIGVGGVVFSYPALFEMFKWIGAGYLFYLAWRFFRSSGPSEQASAGAGFRDGVMLQLFNFKALTVPLIMYTQFLEPGHSSTLDSLMLTLMLFGLILGSLFTWVMGGNLLQSVFRSEFGRKWQGKCFGILLAGVAVWMLIR